MISRAAGFLWLFAAGLVIYVFSASPPSSSPDDENMMLFKKPLAALVQGDVRFAFAQDLYRGTPFEGREICLSLRDGDAEAGQDGQRNELARLLPHHPLAVQKLNLSDATPSALVAASMPDGRLVLAAGNAKLQAQPRVNVGIESVRVQENGAVIRTVQYRGRRCVPFADAVFILSYRESNKQAYAVLADRRSPSLWPYGGVMPADIASAGFSR